MYIVSKFSEILKSGHHLSEMENQMVRLMKSIFTDELAISLEKLDLEIIQPYLSEGWEIDCMEKRQLTFLFGDVVFKRRRLRKAGEKSFLPLDQALGLEKGQHITPGLQERLAKISTGMTFRQASDSVKLLADLSISHTSIHTISQKVAKKIEQYELSQKELRRPKVLYIEGDGLWIGSQEKGKHLEFKRGFVHEGVMETSKGRKQLINPVYFGTFGKSSDLFRQIGSYLEAHYDLSQTVIVANSDGGSGYESSKFEDILGRVKSYHYCLDSYHVMQYVTGKLGFDKGLQGRVRQAVKDYSCHGLEVLLDTAESFLEDDKSLEKLASLRAYLERNWQAIRPLSQRGLGISDGVGVCESGHRYYSNRMKRQGRNWRKDGAENMAILLTAMRNGVFEEAFRAAYQEPEFGPELEISMRQVLKKAVHEEHRVPLASIPVVGSTSSPLGRLRKGLGA